MQHTGGQPLNISSSSSQSAASPSVEFKTSYKIDTTSNPRAPKVHVVNYTEDATKSIRDQINTMCDFLNQLYQLFNMRNGDNGSHITPDIINALRKVLDILETSKTSSNALCAELKYTIDKFPDNKLTSIVDPRYADEPWTETFRDIKECIVKSGNTKLNRLYDTTTASVLEDFCQDYIKKYPDTEVKTVASLPAALLGSYTLKETIAKALSSTVLELLLSKMPVDGSGNSRKLYLPRSDNKSNQTSVDGTSANSNLFDLFNCGFGADDTHIGNGYDPLNSLNTSLGQGSAIDCAFIDEHIKTFTDVNNELREIKNDILDGRYSKSLLDSEYDNDFVGGEDPPETVSVTAVYADQDGLKPQPSEAASNKAELMALYEQYLTELHRYMTSYSPIKLRIIAYLTIFCERLATHLSIIYVQQGLVFTLHKNVTIELLCILESDDIASYRVILRRMVSDPWLKQYYGACVDSVKHCLIVLDWIYRQFYPEDDPMLRGRIGELTKAKECNQKRMYLQVYKQPIVVHQLVLILAGIDHIIKAYNSRAGTNVQTFLIYNNWEEGHRIIAEKEPTELGAPYETLRQLSPEGCMEMFDGLHSNGSTQNPTIVVDDQNVTVPDSSQYNVDRYHFTAIFSNCSIGVIAKLLQLRDLLEGHVEELKKLLTITNGYSGSGKTSNLFGVFVPGKNERRIPGLLQYVIREMSGKPMYMDIIEFAGKMIPATNAVNKTADGIIDSFTYVKHYSDNEEFRETGIYDHTNEKDGYDAEKFKYFTDSKPGSIIVDPAKIRTNFKDMYTPEYTKKTYKVPAGKENHFIDTFSNNVAYQIEKGRKMRYRSIGPTSNNRESSRSVLQYIFAFEISPGKFSYYVIIDFPGKEDPIQTYIYSNQTLSNKESMIDDIIAEYGPSMYPREELSLMLSSMALEIPSHTTFFHLMVLNVFILIGMDKLFNIVFINKLNEYIKEEGVSEQTVKQIIDIVKEKPIDVALGARSLKLKQFINFDDGEYNKGEFPQVLDWTREDKTIDNRSIPVIHGNEEEYKRNSLFYSLCGTSVAPTRSQIGTNTNGLRLIYIGVLFEVLSESSQFNNCGLVTVLLQSFKTTLAYPGQRIGPASDYEGLANFFGVKGNTTKINYLCNTLNRIFEAYFINETINLIVRDLRMVTGTIPQSEYDNSLYQGKHLDIRTQIDYILKRLFSTGSSGSTMEKYNLDIDGAIIKCNPIIKLPYEAVTGFGPIYSIPVYKEFDYLTRADTVEDMRIFDKMKKNLSNETSSLYNYSKLVSLQNNNKLLEIMRIKTSAPNESLNILVFYVISDYSSNIKCVGSSNLLKSMKPVLDELLHIA